MTHNQMIIRTLAIGCLAAASLSVDAQTPSSSQARPAGQSAAPAETSARPSQDGPGPEGDASFHPVLQVTSVEVIRSTRPPELDIVRVKGVSSTDGWIAPQLIPLTRGPSADGILDMVFIAQAPSEGARPSGFGNLEATFVVEPGHPFKGVRVHGANNAVTLAKLPGYSEVAVSTEDCKSCEGKFFVAKGTAAPAGKNAVREEDLPSGLRVIKATDGIRKFDIDPNRLTLLLGENGVIVYAVWD